MTFIKNKTLYNDISGVKFYCAMTSIKHYGHYTSISYLLPKKKHNYLLNILVIGSIVFLAFSASNYTTNLAKSKNEKITTESRADIKVLPAVIYKSVVEIGFIPTVVNSYTFDTNLKTALKEQYPDADEATLTNVGVQTVLTWAALRDFYAPLPANPEVELSTATTNVALEQIDIETTLMKADYEKNLLIFNGFYLKTRFAGTYPENLVKLDKTENALKPIAKEKIDTYIADAKLLFDPSGILTRFNSDPTLVLMNNEEDSVEFTGYTGSVPLFDDPDLYERMTDLKAEEFSEPFILKTQNPHKPKEFQDYAYLSFYISEKTGENMPIEELVNRYIKKTSIR